MIIILNKKSSAMPESTCLIASKHKFDKCRKIALLQLLTSTDYLSTHLIKRGGFTDMAKFVNSF